MWKNVSKKWIWPLYDLIRASHPGPSAFWDQHKPSVRIQGQQNFYTSGQFHVMRWHSLSHLKAPLPLVFFVNCALSLGLPAGTALTNCPRSLVALINYIFICLVGQGVTKAEVRGRPLRVSSLLPSCGFGGSDWGHQAWPQVFFTCWVISQTQCLLPFIDEKTDTQDKVIKPMQTIMRILAQLKMTISLW